MSTHSLPRTGPIVAPLAALELPVLLGVAVPCAFPSCDRDRGVCGGVCAGVPCFDGGTDVPLVSPLLSFTGDDAEGRRDVNWAMIGDEKDLEESSLTGFEMCEVTEGAATTVERGLAKVCLRPADSDSSDFVREEGLSSPPDSPLLPLCTEDCDDAGGVGYGMEDSG